MPLITISREIGTGGTYIALKLAEAFDCTSYDQQIIHEIAKKMGKNKDQITDFDQDTYNRIGVFFQEALSSIAQGGMVFHPFGIGPLNWDSAEIFATYPHDTFREKDYFEILTQVIKDVADKESAVFLGRGAGLILRDYQNTFNLRLVGDEKDRIEHVMKEQKIDEAKAKQLITQKDCAASSFIYDFFDKDWNDPHIYDMTLNTSRINQEDCIKLILHKLGKG